MDNQYQYSNSRDRSQYNMIRTLQSPSVGSGPHGRFEGMGNDLQQGGGMQRNSMMSPNAYVSQGSYGHHQLPPLHSRDSSQGQHGGQYGQMPRPSQSTPVSGSMGFSSSYMSQPHFPSTLPQFPGNQSLPHYSQSQHMGMQNGVMPYHPDYPNATTGITDFRGMTATTHGQPMQDSMAQSYHMPQHPDHDYGARTHVVGAQGRRGILPSDEGRPSALGPNKSTKSTVIPQKDENGKFPCPHCNKTYLHAKHLKRHLLRHTGDRPYSCILCNDTFSRSDILKRHFQKCSIRRGNPTGATHLSNSASWLKKQAKAKANSTGGSSGGGQDARPTTSDSGDSAVSSQHSGTELAGFDHHQHSISSEVGGAPASMSGTVSHSSSISMAAGQPAPGQQQQQQQPGGAHAQQPHGQYGAGGLHSSPTASPGTARPPMGFYESQPYQPNAYMGS